ncbi:luciferin 4-monooxygenase-like [Battus philenor]|uniref:luciferin 4-monooxygenase-like n=1 Tax=Battus philenor TaxID=42288 RepID=UPI0035D09390
MDSVETLKELADYSHIGHVFFHCIKKKPNDICQIDAATGQEETNSSVLSRTIRLAQAMRKFGLKPGDVLAFGGNNHLDLHIPYYAGLMNGYPIVGVDPLYKLDELRSLFKITQPKIAFCPRSNQDLYRKAAMDLGLDLKVVTYEDGEESMKQFLELYNDHEPESQFKLAEFDTEKIYIFLVTTSGTSNTVKVAAFKHKDVLKKFISFLTMMVHPRNRPTIGLNLSPVQWISGIFNAICMPMTDQTKLQTSNPDDVDHLIDVINKYKPHTALISPTLMLTLMKRKHEIDFSCFKSIIVSGAKVNYDVLYEMKEYLKKTTVVMETYGMTETLGPIFAPNITGPKGSCGSSMPSYDVKLVDPVTGVEITEPYVPGELLAKGYGFTEYLQNPEETKNALTEDGYIKTGDLLYRDEEYNFYFVERIKMMIKYRNAQIVPLELEDVIQSHPGVLHACVVGIPHAEDCEHPAACVVRKPGSTVTAQDIKELVASKLSKSKELRGGVVFVDKLPMTSTGKIAVGKVKKYLHNAIRE